MGTCVAFALCAVVLARIIVAVDVTYTVTVAPSSYNTTGCGFYSMNAVSRCNSTSGAYVAYADECQPGTNSCEAAPEYLDIACANEPTCTIEVPGGNTKALCLAITNAGGGPIICDVSIKGEISPESDDDLAWPAWKITAVAVGGGVGLALLLTMIFVLLWCICGDDKNGPKVAPAPHPMDIGPIPYNPGIYPMQYAGLPGGNTNPADKTPATFGPKSNQGASNFAGPMVLNMHGFPVPYLSPQMSRLPA